MNLKYNIPSIRHILSISHRGENGHGDRAGETRLAVSRTLSLSLPLFFLIYIIEKKEREEKDAMRNAKSRETIISINFELILRSN